MVLYSNEELWLDVFNVVLGLIDLHKGGRRLHPTRSTTPLNENITTGHHYQALQFHQSVCIIQFNYTMGHPNIINKLEVSQLLMDVVTCNGAVYAIIKRSEQCKEAIVEDNEVTQLKGKQLELMPSTVNDSWLLGSDYDIYEVFAESYLCVTIGDMQIISPRSWLNDKVIAGVLNEKMETEIIFVAD